MDVRNELLNILKSEVGEFKNGEPPHFISHQVRLNNILSSSSSGKNQVISDNDKEINREYKEEFAKKKDDLNRRYDRLKEIKEDIRMQRDNKTLMVNDKNNGGINSVDSTSLVTLTVEDPVFTTYEETLNWKKWSGNPHNDQKIQSTKGLITFHDNDANATVFSTRMPSRGSKLHKEDSSLNRLREIHGISGTNELTQFIKLMNKINLFKDLSINQLATLEEKSEFGIARQNSVILPAGTLPDVFIVISDGCVSKGMLEGDEMIEIVRLYDGDSFGLDLVGVDDSLDLPTPDDLLPLQHSFVAAMNTEFYIISLESMHEVFTGELASYKDSMNEVRQLAGYGHRFRLLVEIFQKSLAGKDASIQNEFSNREKEFFSNSSSTDKETEIKDMKKSRRISLTSTQIAKATKTSYGFEVKNISSLTDGSKALALDLVAASCPELNFIDSVQHLLRLAKDFFNVERTGFLLVNNNVSPSRLELLVSQNESVTSLPLTGISGFVARTGEVVYIRDCYRDKRFDPTMDLRFGLRTSQMLALPVRGNNNEVEGVIQLINPKDLIGFDDKQISLAGLIAAHLEELLVSKYSFAYFNQAVTEKQMYPLESVDAPLRIRVSSLKFRQAEDRSLSHVTVGLHVYHGHRQIGPTLYTRPSPTRIDEQGHFTLSDPFFWIECNSISLAQLPLGCRLVFRIYSCTADSKGAESSLEIAWSATSLFSYNQNLITGPKRLHLMEGCCVSPTTPVNPSDTNSALVIDLPGFDVPVVYNVMLSLASDKVPERPDPKQYWNSMKPDESEQLRSLLNDPLEKAYNPDKRLLLWRMRHALREEARALPRWIESVEWFRPDVVSKTYNMLYSWHEIGVDEALQLLDGRFPDPKVRAYAVQTLNGLSESEMLLHLYHLTQALDYEMLLDNALARLLLRHALTHPTTIGVQLYWILQARARDSKPISRNKTALASVMNKSFGNYAQMFRKQGTFISSLTKIYRDLQVDNTRSGPDRNKALRILCSGVDIPKDAQYLFTNEDSEYSLAGDKCSMLDDNRLRIQIESTGKRLPSKSLLITFNLDLRRERVVQHLLSIFKHAWDSANLGVCFTHQNCLITLRSIAFVDDIRGGNYLIDILRDFPLKKRKIAFGITISDRSLGIKANDKELIQKKLAINQFEDDGLWQWLLKNNHSLSEFDIRRNFIRSCAAYTAAIYVLGLRRGDSSNVFIRRSGEVIHTGFNDFLIEDYKNRNRKQKGTNNNDIGENSKRMTKTPLDDQLPFFLPNIFKFIIGEKSSDSFKEFCGFTISAYNILRKKTHVIISTLSAMNTLSITELRTSSDVEFISDNLMPNASDFDAGMHLKTQIARCWN